MAQYLPPKTEYVVLCRPTEAQVTIYDAVVSSTDFGSALKNSPLTLQLINVLKKVCNSPALLLKTADVIVKDTSEATPASLVDSIPQKLLRNAQGSGKLSVLDSLLHTIHSTTEEKVVLMSNYTSTLDRLQNFLTSLSYSFLRLDGSTQTSKRMDLVDTFNRTSSKSNFVFLLSTKAGGLGLNLVGASRLILYDIDWNPSYDMQAMARICRDGQKRPCFIYRLLTKGAIEEKIWQRQVTKQGLADSVVDSKHGFSSFSYDELKDLFSLDRRQSCQTHDLLGCDCHQDGLPPEIVDETLPAQDGEEDDDDELPDLQNGMPGWMTASQLEASPYRDIAKSKKSKSNGKMMGLMQYSHVDAQKVRCLEHADTTKKAGAGEDLGSEHEAASNPGVDVDDSEAIVKQSAVEDTVLRSAVLEPGSHVDYIFSKISTPAKEEEIET